MFSKDGFIKTLEQVDLYNQRILIRADLNVPIYQGKIVDESRIKAILPTLEICLAANARIILLSHLGRPKEGTYDETFSLKPVANVLSQYLKKPIPLVKNWLSGLEVAPGEMVLCENVRFEVGETTNDEVLARKIAALGDIFVMDAFASAHRAHASTVGVARYSRIAIAGPLLLKELTALSQMLKTPKRPLVALIGGGKVSDKLQLLQALLLKVDTVMVGGGVGNTLIKAAGYSIGNSLYEPACIEAAKQLIEFAKAQAVNLKIPIDGIAVEEGMVSNHRHISHFSQLKADEKIVDIGPKTLKQYEDILKIAATIIWNGPVGMFEINNFANGTKKLAEIIAHTSAYSVAGGGETLAAIKRYQLLEKFSYVSTGGAAFLTYLEGKTLPGIEALIECNRLVAS